MDNITFQQIEAFISIAETLNLSKSAKALYTSQPSLSRQLSKFEALLNTKLFSRSNRGVVLTPEGEYLYNELLPVYHKMRLALHNVQNVRAQSNKTLRIGSHTASDMMYDFDRVKIGIKQFSKIHPEIDVIESIYEFKELRQALIYGEVDIIFSVSVGLEDLNNVTRRCISALDLHIAMSQNHALAKCESLDIRALNNEVFIFPSSKDTQTRRNNELEQCNHIGFSPKSIQYLPNLSSVIKAVRSCSGMTMCGKFRDFSTDGPVKFFELDIPSFADQPCVEAAWRSNDVSREALELVRMIEEL